MLSSSSIDCSEDGTVQTISIESTEAENEINLPQATGKTLSARAVIDIIDRERKITWIMAVSWYVAIR